MPKKLVVLIMLCMAGYESIAQKVVFDLNARVNFIQPDQYSETDTFQGYFSNRLDDTTVIRRYSTFFQTSNTNYYPGDAFEVNGLFTIKLSGRLSLRTGLGLNYGTYTISTSGSDFGSELISIDTIYSPISTPNPGGGGSTCDCYENSYSDVSADYDPNTHEQLLNLAMPAELGYDIIPDKLTIRAGAYFHTPLYAGASREDINLEKNIVEEMVKCKWVKVKDKTNALSGVSNFQWGVSAWASYNIIPGLAIEAGVRQQVSDVYVNQEDQFFNFDNNSYKPFSFSVGLSYRLYKGVQGGGL